MELRILPNSMDLDFVRDSEMPSSRDLSEEAAHLLGALSLSNTLSDNDSNFREFILISQNLADGVEIPLTRNSNQIPIMARHERLESDRFVEVSEDVTKQLEVALYTPTISAEEMDSSPSPCSELIRLHQVGNVLYAFDTALYLEREASFYHRRPFAGESLKATHL